MGQFRRNTKTRGVYKLGSEGFVYLFRLFSKVSTAECVSKRRPYQFPPPNQAIGGTHARHQMALSAADHKRLVRMREIEHAQTRKKERAKGRRGASTERTIVRTPAKLSNSEPAVSWQGGRAAAAAQRMTRQAEAAPLMMPSNRTMVIALVRARNQAGRSHDMAMFNRLSTSEGASAFLRQRRMHAYSRLQSNANGAQSAREARLRQSAEQEIATQTETEEEAAAAAELMASDEQALDDLAQADLAYLQMVRHKMGHTGALTSSAEHLLAESWQQYASRPRNSCSPPPSSLPPCPSTFSPRTHRLAPARPTPRVRFAGSSCFASSLRSCSCASKHSP